MQSRTMKTIIIGHQEWMAENLNVTHFRNSDPVPQFWENRGDKEKPAWSFYGDKSENEKMYGRLYNWYAVTDPRNLAPAGWHIPDQKDWAILIDFLGGIDIAGEKLTPSSKETEFRALAGGMRTGDGDYGDLARHAYFWTASETNSVEAWYIFLKNGKQLKKYSAKKLNSFSVRCVRNI